VKSNDAMAGESRPRNKFRRPDRKAKPPETAASLLDRQPPYSLEAEVAVLGSMLLMPTTIDDVATELRAADFHFDANQALFMHLVEMRNAGKNIDMTLLVERLRDHDDYERIGGAPYIAEVLSKVHNAAHARYYADIVRQKSVIRSVIGAATDILQEAYHSETPDAERLLSQAEEKIFSIGEKRSGAGNNDVKEIFLEALDRLDARMRGESPEGAVEFGFGDLDHLTGGLRASELVILAARPSMGKTAFAMNIAENVVRLARVPVLFVSLEMAAIELIERMLCSVARVDSRRLKNGSVSKEERIRLKEHAAALSSVPLSIDDSPSRTVGEIASTARRIKRRQNGLGLVVIDYLQLIEPDNSSDPRQEQVAKIARRLKGLSRELKVPVLCLSQLNRQAEDSRDHRPRMSHLRESGAIEQDADVVMFVHREEYYLRGEAKEEVAGQAQIIVEKQRNGPTGEIELTWIKEFTRFEDRAPIRHGEFENIPGTGGNEYGF
jgi:replicative DNA helicase